MARRRTPSKRPSRRRPTAGGRLALAILLLTVVAITGWVVRLFLSPTPAGPPTTSPAIQRPQPPRSPVLPATPLQPSFRQPIHPAPEVPPSPPAPLRPQADIPPPPPPRPHGPGQLVLIIDDLGQELLPAATLTQLGLPIVFSILPYAPKAAATAQLAQQAGHEILVHLPCEPKQEGRRVSAGRGALMAGMDAKHIEALLDAAFARVPGAIGANNHMGSRFTEDPAGVLAMMQALQARGKLFIDSVTTPKTALPAVCRQLNIPYLRRTVFLDNVPSTAAVLGQLQKAEALAQKHGVAIAIGHPHAATLRALAIWARERSGSVSVVSLAQARQLLLARSPEATALSVP